MRWACSTALRPSRSLSPTFLAVISQRRSHCNHENGWTRAVCSARRGVRHGWPGLSLGTMRCTCAAITAGCMIQAPLRPIAPSDLPTDAFCFTCMRCARHRGRLLPPPPRTRTSACGLPPRRVRRHARRHARHVHVDARCACTCRQWFCQLCAYARAGAVRCSRYTPARHSALCSNLSCPRRWQAAEHHTRRLARGSAQRGRQSGRQRGSSRLDGWLCGWPGSMGGPLLSVWWGSFGS